MALGLLIGIAVEETVDTASAEGCGGNALAFVTGPGARLLARAEGFDRASDQRSLGSLSPLALVAPLVAGPTRATA